MHTRFLKAVLMLVASVFCTLDHDTAKAQSVIHLTSPVGGEIFHPGDTMRIRYTAPTGGCAPEMVQIGLYDTRFSGERGDGEELLLTAASTGGYDWVIPASYGEISDGVIGGTHYAISVNYAGGGVDSSDVTPPFTILPLLASDTTMAASFTASTPGICGNTGAVTFAFTGSCVDSSNVALSWDFGNYYYGGVDTFSVSYTRWTATVHYRLLQASSTSTQVKMTMIDTATGARRWWQMAFFVDSNIARISGTVPGPSGFKSYSDTIHVCSGDSLRLNMAVAEWLSGPARYSWTSGDTVNEFISHSYGMNVATLTDDNGCPSKDSVYIMLDTACAGAHAPLSIRFWKSGETVCQYQYLFFADSTKNESIHHIRYEYDFSRSASLARYWDSPVPPYDVRFDSAGTFWLKFSAYDSVSGITGIDSQMITVQPAPYVTVSPEAPVLTSCSGTWLVATTDVPAYIVWEPPAFALGRTYTHSDSLLAIVSAYYMVSATDTTDGCRTETFVYMVDSIHYTYDTTADTLRNFYAIDSLPPVMTSFATIDSFLTTDLKVYVHDTGSTATVTIDSVFLDHLSHQVHNNCGTLMFSCDTATGYDTTFRILATTTHHPWNDTVSCMDAVFFTTNSDSFATVSDSSTSILVVDTVLIPGGKMARMDTLSIHFHSSDSFRVTHYFSGQFNHCTSDTTSRTLDSNAYVTTVLASWADTIPHDGPTIWCSSDTIYDVSDYTVLDSSAVPTTVATTKSDTSHITGGIIVTIDTMIVFTHPVDSIHVHDSIMHITSHCTLSALFDTSYITVHITHGSYTDSALHPGISGDTIRFTTGIDQIALEEPQLYPNPASQNAWLDVPENFGAFEISLSAADGKKIATLTGTAGKNLLDLSGLADGTYLVSVRKTSDPHFMWAQKLTKQ